MPLPLQTASTAVSEPPCGTVEDRLALVERVASSAAFSKSIRLRDFLRYVGPRAARLDSAEVHEQEIGEKVFGRGPGYDRSQDNIVRVNATELRRRVDTYFATEGAGDSLVFSIPRGSYMPVFRVQATPVRADTRREPDAVVVNLQTVPALVRARRHVSWLVAMSIVLGVGCALLFWQNTRLRHDAVSPEKRPAVDTFWANMINSSRDTDVVLPDDSISVEEEITRKRIGLMDYTDRNFVHHLDVGGLSPDRVDDLQLILSHNLVTLGGFFAGLRIHDLAPRSNAMHLVWARFYSADSMKRDNVVLIGGAKANPWVSLYEDQLNFKFDYNNPSRSLFIENSHPQPGEVKSFLANSTSRELAGYSVVAFLPNPSNKGNVVLLLGSDSDASNAAAEYMTSEENLTRLLQTFHRRSFPHFELLLEVSRVRGTSLAAKMIAYRVYP